METNQINDQVAIIENSIEVLKTGPQILQANQIRKNKAIQVGSNILNAIEEGGMDPAMDERAMKYLANIGNANKEMREQRSGVTQIMDQLKKMYTEVENELDPKKPGTVPCKIQSHRDLYAKKIAADKAERERLAAVAAAKAKEAIEIEAQMESNYKDQYHNYLSDRKTKLQSGFNMITLDNYEQKAKALKELSFTFQFTPAGPYTSLRIFHHNPDDLKRIADKVVIDNEPGLAANFMAELALHKDDLIEKLPSKFSELKQQKRLADEAAAEVERQRIEREKREAALATANAKEKKRLEAEAEQHRIENEKRNAELKRQQEEAAAQQREREQADTDRIAKENEEAKRKAELEIEVKKQGEQTMVLFEQEAAMAEVGSSPEARQGYEITVLHPVGFTQIFALYFEHEGKNLPVDKLGNTKLDQMKTWCEKKAAKDGTRIDSKFIKYEDSFKAVNRKSK